jgi:chitinase
MVYDIWGSFSTGGVGPNAPLNDSCAPSQDQQGSAVSALKAWTNAKFPASQIVLGVPAYGHSFTVTPGNALLSGNKLASYPQFSSVQNQGDSSDVAGGTDACGNYDGLTGIFNFWGLIADGYLTSAGLPAENMYARYDACSETACTFHYLHQKSKLNDFS